MDKQIEAARRAEGVIVLDGESNNQVKNAVEKVSTIKDQDDNQLYFEGQRIIDGAGYGLIVNCYDVYKCPNGYLMHVYMDNSPNWAIAAKTIAALLDAIPQREIARRAHGEMVKKGLVSLHHKI